ncbi:MAG: GIY-YIG nuclease family protein [Bacteroidetes bacterium]|nr:GIY-YIG nuclease family protein [Bacteroidota bacterium]
MKKIAKDIASFKKIEIDIQTCQDINLSDFEVDHVIYLFKLTNLTKEFDDCKFCKEFSAIKKKAKYKLPQVNEINTTKNNDVLYIGKSSGLFSTRLRNHFSSNSLKTYSLQLPQLAKQKKLQHLKMEMYYSNIDYAKHSITDHDLKKELLEMLESSLHLQHKPLLGRSGH